MFGLGGIEIAIIALVAILLFGGSLPGVMRSLGRSIPAFKAGLTEVQSEIQDVKEKVDAVKEDVTKTITGKGGK